jgi:glycosyltransferase involved in cell wall biosynthesis
MQLQVGPKLAKSSTKPGKAKSLGAKTQEVDGGRRSCLLILGMHRSGTSALTRLFSMLGASLPRRLIGIGSGNERGHWEPQALVAYHNRLLAELGSEWWDWGPLNLRDLPVAHRAQIKADLIEILTEDFGQSPLFAIKDPRISRFPDFFVSVLEAMQCQTKAVLAFRNPLDVIDSLIARKEFWSIQRDRTDAALLWLSHMLEAERGARRLPHAIISYETLMEDPVGSMKRLVTKLGLAVPISVEEAAEDIGRFVDNDQRHHARKPEDVLLDPSVAGWVADTFLALRDLEHGRNVAGAHATLDRVAAEFASALPLLKSVTDARRATGAELSGAKASVLAERDAREGSEAKLAAALSEGQSVQQRFTQAQAELADLRQAIAASEAQLDETRTHLAQKAAQLAESRAQLAELAEQTARAEAEAARAAALQDQQIAALRSEAEILRQQTSQSQAALAAALAETQSQEARLRVLSADLDEARRDAEQAYLSHEVLHQAYRSSTSWRLTAPVRMVGRIGRWVIRLPATVLAVVRFSGGLRPAFGKAVRVMRQEGMDGIHLRLRVVQPDAPGGAATRPVSTPVSDRSAAGASAPVPGAASAQPALQGPTSGGAAGRSVSGYLEQILALPVANAGTADFVEKSPSAFDLSEMPVQAIAFYLPQFHPIPENDAWWGKGFTEWTNVSKAVPQFVGHYQPHLPGELGFYDLRLVDVQRQQAELARHYGIKGFCFHHYWFGGRRLLERPFAQLLANPDIDINFCLCWANENWTRRWDGNEQDVLMGQAYSPQDDLAFIADIAPALRDPRYIRFKGRPLLMVYRVDQLPDARATAERWRDYCRCEGIGEIYLMIGRTFGLKDPRPYGFDAAVEFPPHNAERVAITDLVKMANPGFEGIVYDFEAMARGYRDEGEAYPLVKTVSPGWDNEARKPGKGHIFHGATPRIYGAWLSRAREQTLKALARNPEQPPFVFINAWNEWAEGAHLEPDRRFGYGYLDATARVLAGQDLPQVAAPADPKRIAVVSHDANPHGAQYLALNLCKTLASTFGLGVDCVLLQGGSLAAQFAEVAQLHDLGGQPQDGPEAQRIAEGLRASGVDVAICNTTVSGLFARTLAAAGIRVISLVHELPELIRDYALEPHVAALAEASEKVVFAAPMIAEQFRNLSGLAPDRQVIRPQGAYKRNRLRGAFGPASDAARDMRRRHGIAAGAKLVLAVGYADHRKGFDLFLDATERCADPARLVFCWVGHQDMRLMVREKTRIDRLLAAGKLVLTGLQQDTDAYYAGADLYLLTSREDPYPSTVLEALDVGLPVLGFAGATGTVDLIEASGGQLVPLADVPALSAAINAMLQAETPDSRAERARAFWRRPDVSFQAYVHDLLDLLGRGPRRVSAVVPNFNYARFLPARIDSILRQTHPVSELILLDDASTDDSMAVIEAAMARIDIPVTVIRNEANSGSVFRQWLRGAEAAQGRYLWLAEADDLAEPEFLATVLAGFEDDHVVLSYCQSKQMAQDGRILAETYLDYVKDVSPGQWTRDYRRGGADEIVDGLSVKNTIPNVSAVVFHRQAFLDTMRACLDEILQFRVAGDWCVYVRLLGLGSCAFFARSLNLHRRHAESVTINRFGESELNEIIVMQEKVRQMPGGERHTARAGAYVKELRQQFGLAEG